MKRILFPLLILLFVAQACGPTPPTPPAQPTRKAAPAGTEAPVQPGEQQSAPTAAQPAPPTAQPTSPAQSAPENPAQGASPSGGGEIDVTQLTETDTDILGIYRNDVKVYNEVLAAGAHIVNLEPMHTFFVVWVPEGYEQMPTRRVMVVAHGHTGSSYFQMAQELPFAQEHGYAVVSIQWWTGEGEKMYSGEQFYAFMDAALRYMAYKYNAQLDKCAYRGWSMGSGISYEVTYLDRINGTNYLQLTISHDGGMMPDASQMAVGREFVSNLYDGVYGDDVFAGKHFYLYAGQPGQAEYMRNTSEVITRFGGVVEQLIEDVNAGHAGFFAHPQYHEEAIEIFFQLAP